MMKYKSTILAISVHSDMENPIFGEGATHVCLEDEAGGPFIILKQTHDQAEPGQVRLSFEEIPLIVKAIDQLKAGAKYD
jgi:hypothetical protein